MNYEKIKYFSHSIKDITELEEDLHGLRYIYIKSKTLKNEIEDYCYVKSIKIELVPQLFPKYWDLCTIVRQAERKLMYGGK